MLRSVAIILISFIPFYGQTVAEICIKSIFLHSPEPLRPTSKLFCVVRQNENVRAAETLPFVTTSRFEKYVPLPNFVLPKQKDGNRTVIAVEGTPETSPAIRWLNWNGTSCINAISQVVLTFFIGDGLLLENMSASFIYANITNKNYRQQQYRFDAIFINRLANQDNVEPKSTGYEAGDLIRTSLSTGTFSLPFGSECNDTQQMEVKFGFHISTACRIRVTTCAQMTEQIRDVWHRWDAVQASSLPFGNNSYIAVRSFGLPSLKKAAVDESCELITAATIQFGYVRFGTISAFSHKLVSCNIEFSKPDIVDLTTYSYRYIYLSLNVYFVDESSPPVQIFSRAPTIDIVLPPDFFYPFFTKT